MPNPYPQPHSTISQLDADLGQHSDSTAPAPYEVPKTAYGAGIANPLLADLAAGGHKITGLADPAADQDAATKDYVDDAIPLVIPLPRIAAGVPLGAPVAGENGMAIDTTAVSGGTYGWSGSAWVKEGA
jgi:hypothetical protein